MCDHLSHNYGYICYECLDELSSKGECDVREFLDTEKRGFDSDAESWSNWVAREFGATS